MFGANFLKIRNDYALNLLDSDINISDYKQLSFKDNVLNNVQSAKNPSKDTYLLDVPIKLYYKSINAEFELYHVRSMLQFKDFKNIDNVSENWKFTTFYYFLFFSNVALHRLLNKGYVYLNTDNAFYLTHLLNNLLPSLVNIGTGNWSFRKISETSSVVTIEFKKAGSNIHQLSWQDLRSTLKQFSMNTSKKVGDSENAIIINLYDKLKNNHDFNPSETRNYLNYVSDVAIEEIQNKIKCPQIKLENYVKSLTSLNYSKNLKNDILLSLCVGQYVYLFNNEIIKDLNNRKAKHFQLTKKLSV